MENFKLIPLIFMLLFPHFSHAQGQEIDSLRIIFQSLDEDTTRLYRTFATPVPDHSAEIDSIKSNLGGLSEDTVKVNTLNRIASLISFENSNDAIKYGTEARLLAEKLHYRKGLALAYRNIGIGYYLLQN